MKALSKIYFLFVTILVFAIPERVQGRLVEAIYEEEPAVNLQTGEVSSSRGFQYIGNPFQAPTYNPKGPRYSTVREISSKIEQIKVRDKIRCGSNLQVRSFAYQEDGMWHGVDADFCRVFAQALLGDSQKIEMVNVVPNRVAEALNQDKIDVMLSGAGYVAAMETAQKAVSAGVLYHDHQMVMTKDVNATDLEQMKGKKICLSTDTDYFQNFDNYNTRHGLGITYLSFDNLAKAKEAFLLNRCQMMTASGLMLNGILQDMPAGKAKILPNFISLKPVYAFVQKDSTDFRLAIKWILNALLLAEQHGINVQNLEFFASNDNQEIRNLLGDDETLWQNMNVNPHWVREVIALLGNYADIFDRNMGNASDYKLLRREGCLVKDGGTVYPVPFL